MALPALAVGTLTYIQDPYIVYHPADQFPDNMRYLAPGLARHMDHEVVVLGDSMSQNFLPSVIEKTLGAKGLNLTISGSTLFEQRKVFEAASRNGKVRRVIWGINPRAAKGEVERLSDENTFPLHLYDANPFNDWRYLFNRDNVTLSWHMLRHPPPPVPLDLDLYNTWHTLRENAPGRARVLSRYRRPRGVTQNVPEDLRLERLTASFDHNVLATIRAHREVAFEVFFPPFSDLYHVSSHSSRPRVFNTHTAFYRYVMKALNAEPNARVFYFDNATRVTGDLDNYKDWRHYWVHVNN